MRTPQNWHFSFNGTHITLAGPANLHMDNIAETLIEFAKQYQLTVGEMVMGADRLQLSIQWQADSYLLCFEALCEATWIDCYYAQNMKQLADLYSYLLMGKDNNYR